MKFYKNEFFRFQGAIFGITYYQNLLCTVGDDRTVKLYNFHNSLQLLASFFAHEARIWQSCITSTHILTCGEDSSIRLWSHKPTGEILRSFSVHRCKSVWCMDILRDADNNKPLIIISGWSDGGVRRYHLDDVPTDLHETILLNKNFENDFPRNVIFLNSVIMIVHMNSGQLLKVDKQNISVFYDGRNTLKNGYAKMSIANDENQYLAVGSLNGFVVLFDQNGTIINEFQIEINKNNKILQILWLNNTLSSKLLVCIPDGIMVNRN
jgi:WD40 repeat protein